MRRQLWENVVYAKLKAVRKIIATEFKDISSENRKI